MYWDTLNKVNEYFHILKIFCINLSDYNIFTVENIFFNETKCHNILTGFDAAETESTVLLFSSWHNFMESLLLF